MTELGGAGTNNLQLHAQRPWLDRLRTARAGGPHRPLHDPKLTLPDGEPGELMVRGPLVMLGYYGNKQATQAAIEPGGWLHTGDIATRDDEGHYFIVDRKKDLIITGGFNVYPAEIERVVASHPAVAMVAVGSVPDEIHGELARAYVVLRPGATATELTSSTTACPHLAAYKRPLLCPVRARPARDIHRQGHAPGNENPRQLNATSRLPGRARRKAGLCAVFGSKVRFARSARPACAAARTTPHPGPVRALSPTPRRAGDNASISHQTTLPLGSLVRYQSQRALNAAARNSPRPLPARVGSAVCAAIRHCRRPRIRYPKTSIS